MPTRGACIGPARKRNARSYAVSPQANPRASPQEGSTVSEAAKPKSPKRLMRPRLKPTQPRDRPARARRAGSVRAFGVQGGVVAAGGVAIPCPSIWVGAGARTCSARVVPIERRSVTARPIACTRSRTCALPPRRAAPRARRRASPRSSRASRVGLSRAMRGRTSGRERHDRGLHERPCSLSASI